MLGMNSRQRDEDSTRNLQRCEGSLSRMQAKGWEEVLIEHDMVKSGRWVGRCRVVQLQESCCDLIWYITTAQSYGHICHFILQLQFWEVNYRGGAGWLWVNSTIGGGCCLPLPPCRSASASLALEILISQWLSWHIESELMISMKIKQWTMILLVHQNEWINSPPIYNVLYLLFIFFNFLIFLLLHKPCRTERKQKSEMNIPVSVAWMELLSGNVLFTLTHCCSDKSERK